ncbi:MAG: hypothetical protein P4L69_22025 [Desulfosporosinus sp.]|nr:hypothetical protein [Desulfosporosinus sp.]
MTTIDIFPTDSVYISQFYHNTNFGTVNQLFTGQYFIIKVNHCKPDAYRTLLKFNIYFALTQYVVLGYFFL